MRNLARGGLVLGIALLVVGCASQPPKASNSEDGADLEEVEKDAEEAQEELERETAD